MKKFKVILVGTVMLGVGSAFVYHSFNYEFKKSSVDEKNQNVPVEVISSMENNEEKEELVEEVSVNSSLVVLNDKKLHDIEKENIAVPMSYQDSYETTSKYVYMQTLQSLSTLRYTTTMNSYWYKVPNLKLYDIMAIRFENTSASIYSWEGYQDAYDSSAAGGASYEYHYSEADSPNNYKKINNAGIGVIMNLKDSSSQFNLLLTVTTNGNPNKVYGTYQHKTDRDYH